MFHTHIFIVFVSYVDSVEERNALMSIVYPQLKSFCYQFGYHFHMVNLYWNKECTVREHSILFDAHHLRKATNEIKLCQEFSDGPSFIVRLYYISINIYCSII